MSNILVIAKREYLSRVKTKGFWIATVVLPLLMAALFVLPSLFLVTTKSTLETVVVDETGVLAEALVAEFAPAEEEAGDSTSRVSLVAEDLGADVEAKRAELDARVVAGEIDAWVWVDQKTLDEGKAEYHAESVSNFITQEVLERGVSRVVRHHRLTAAGYDPGQIGDMVRGVDLATVRVSKEGAREEAAEAGIIAAFALFFLLYMILIIYGQQVLQGVLEEKGSRIVEVIVSAVKPFELMMGKLVGICAVALTQLVIWLGTMTILTLPGVISAMAWIPSDVTIPGMTLKLAVNFFLLFLLGFFLFASIYAAVGSAFNNLQEAQQVAGVVVVLIVAPMMFLYSVINDPDSSVAVVTSLIPFLTPLLMLLRIAIKTPPLWQILLAYALTTGTVFLMVHVAARIYRTGILMYGKKPTIKELWRWLRYA